VGLRLIPAIVVLIQTVPRASWADDETTQQQTALRGNTEANAAPLRVSIEASRPNPTAGSGLGVFAELTNLSKMPIVLHENEIALAFAPELDPTMAGVGWYASFPSEWHFESDGKPKYATYTLAPGDSYKALFVRDPSHPTGDSSWENASALRLLFTQAFTEFRYVFFSPGDYKIVVTGTYHVVGQDTPRSFQQTAIVRVSAPQSVVFLGAALGGLIAFILFPKKRITSGSRVRIAVAMIMGAAGSCLLSVMATILASRIADTQFFVRVSVNDLWGAAAVGFIANLAGARLLERFIPPVKVTASASSRIEPPAKPQSEGAASPPVAEDAAPAQNPTI
jgi:hypothetical protein